MSLLLLLNFFTFICKPGIIYGYGDLKEYQNLPSIELQSPNKSEYYFFDSVELENGAYLYVSNEMDSVWFYVEQEVYLPDNQEFIDVNK